MNGLKLQKLFGTGFVGMAVLALFSGVARLATAGAIHAGDILVVDRGNGTLNDVNPVTGASFTIASGFSNPQGLAVNANGMIFVSDIGTSTIDQVDPLTGLVTTFSGNGVGTGPLLDRPFEMAFNAGGTLFVAEGGVPDGNTTGVLAIDSSGNRTFLAANNGSSNDLFRQFLAGLAVNSQGHVFASAPTGGTIYRAGPGTATPLSIDLRAPQGLAVGTSNLFAVNGDPSDPSISSIDVANGIAKLVSDNHVFGSGPAFDVPRGITVAPGVGIYATDVGNNEIYAVNASTGDRLVVSGGGVGGTTFGGLTYGIAVYPDLRGNSAIPEPSSLTILTLASAILAACFGWRRRTAFSR
jgi:sugar lactone lactonase YvrE